MLNHRRFITTPELAQFIDTHLNEILKSDFDWMNNLTHAGFFPQFYEIDFDELYDQLDEIGILTTSFNISNIEFTVCTNVSISDSSLANCRLSLCTIRFIRRSQISNTQFINCTIHQAIESDFTDSFFDNCIFENAEIRQLTLVNTELDDAEFINCTGNFPEQLTLHDPYQHECDTALANTDKPLVVLLSMHEQGRTYYDKFATYLRSKDFKLLSIHPSVGYNHPIFAHSYRINGIVLPGGANIETDPTKHGAREKFESSLIKFSFDHRTPLIGICRGHQALGYYFGGSVADLHEKQTLSVLMLNDQHHPDYVAVRNLPGSLLYQTCIKKMLQGRSIDPRA